MKVLQVNCVYNNGSTGKIVADIHAELLRRGVDSVVCYGRGAKVHEANVYKTCGELYSKFNNLLSRFTGCMYGGCLLSTNKLISIIKKEKPDVVHLHCINGYFVNIYRLVEFLKKNHIKTVLSLHAEFMHTANCGHALECEKWRTGCGDCPRLRRETKSLLIDGTARSWKRMKAAFEGFEDDLVVASVSPWLMERAKQSPIMEKIKHCVVLNGLNTDVFKLYDTSDLKREYGITDEKVVFHATAGFSDDPEHIKGGYYVIKLAEMMKNDNVRFFVAGQHTEGIKVPENVTLLGSVNDQIHLARLYSMSDVTVLTSKKETFSMITAESLCCGTPVVGFKAGAPEGIAIPEYSEFVEYGNVDALKIAVNKLFGGSYDKQDVSKAAYSKYSKIRMVDEYSEVYRKVIEGVNNERR